MKILRFAVVLLLAASAVVRAQDAPPPATAPPSPPAPPTSGTAQNPPPRGSVTRIKIGGNVTGAKIEKRVEPVYPPLARQARISGTVRLRAIIARDGTVAQLEVISGHPLLVQSALDAVHQWRYQPTLLNGQPVEVDTTIDLVYSLPSPPSVEEDGKPVDPQLRADILHLFDVTHAKETAAQAGKMLFDALRPQMAASLPSTPNKDKILDAYLEKLAAVVESDEMIDREVVIYAKYFSDDDVKALIGFYETPAGQHYNSKMPQLFADLSEAGQQGVRVKIPDIFKQLCMEFPELKGNVNICPNPDPEKTSFLIPEELFSKTGITAAGAR